MKYKILKGQLGLKVLSEKSDNTQVNNIRRPVQKIKYNYVPMSYSNRIKLANQKYKDDNSLFSGSRLLDRTKELGKVIKTPAATLAASATAVASPTIAARLLTGATSAVGFGELGMGSGNSLHDAAYGMAGEAVAPLVGKIIDKGIGAIKSVGKSSVELLNKSISNLNDQPPVNNLTSHLQGEDAVKMFKQYGGESPNITNSPLMRRIKNYIPETRERYGIVNNNNISDEEIANSLYKHSKQLNSVENKAVNKYGEPLLLFRGDTKRYDQLLDRITPDNLAAKTGTMDNSLGTLYLGDMPNPNKGQGIDRYITTQRTGHGFFNDKIFPSGTGSKINISEESVVSGTTPLYTTNTKYGDYTISKVPAKFNESGVNDINAFVVRSNGVRNATDEISVLDDDFLSLQENFKGIPGDKSRISMAKHYNNVLKDAELNNQGLLKSNAGSKFREEHEKYDYYTLPNFNRQNAKHLLPYDLRIPRNWKDPNIYKTITGISAGLGALKLNKQ